MEFFAGANTRYGFKSLFDDAFKNIERIFILKGSSGCGKSTLMKTIAQKAQKLKIHSDIIYCSADPNSLDGVILPSLGIAIADGTAPHIMDVKYPCVRETIINLGQFWEDSKLLPHRAEIIGLTDLKSCHYKNAYRALAAAGSTDELLSEIVNPCIDRKKLDNFAFKFAEKLSFICGERKHIFATAFTAEGLQTLPVFENVTTLYHINGKAAKELLTAIDRIFIEKGAEVIVSCDVLEPKYADSIYFPEIGSLITCLPMPPCKNAKSEHNISTSRFVSSMKISEKRNRLRGLEKLKNELLTEACRELLEARNVHNEIESIYIPAMNFKLMDKYTADLSKKIFGE